MLLIQYIFFLSIVPVLSAAWNEDYPEAQHGEHMTRIKNMLKCGFSPTVVFDVGAAIGSWSHNAKKYVLPNASFVMFEGNEFHIPKLKSRNIPFEIAVMSDKLGNHTFYVGDHESPGSSIYRENTIYKFAGRLKPTYTVDYFVKKYELSPQLLKIDTQGAELLVLQGAERALRNSIEVIFLEANIHNYNDGSPPFRTVSHYLAKHGFELYDLFGGNSVNQFVVQVDATFVSRKSPLWSKSCTGFPVPAYFKSAQSYNVQD